MNSLQGKVLIVTGASEGIGACVVNLLRQRRARTVLVARNEEKLRASSVPGELVLAGDLTHEATRVEIVERAMERYGCIDGLLNIAGRGSYYWPSEAQMEDARSLFELNFFAPLRLSQLVTPHVVLTRGSIVHVNSIAGLISLPWLPIYSASKFSLTALAVSQRAELGYKGVHVMSVFPGYVNTAFQEHATGGSVPPQIVKGRRFAISAEECAAAIVRGMERRSKVVVTPRVGWALIWMSRIAPGYLERRMERI